MGRGRKPKIDDLTLLRHFVVSSEPVFTPAEIAKEFDDITKETARNRLESLVQKGFLAKKKPTSRVVIYWITREGKEHFESHAG